ncbi:TOBE domain protein [Calothrix sp. NIES-4071]|nr:TOBE domain protein [Calothrix sp. NIES-4071]BAZ55274.1 TOBE domain protein [Calothrix sp. NIES-4105]
MKVSARNSLKAKIKAIIPGSVNYEVILEILPGVEVTSIITKDAVESLNLKEGQDAYALVKSSDVMIGVD